MQHLNIIPHYWYKYIFWIEDCVDTQNRYEGPIIITWWTFSIQCVLFIIHDFESVEILDVILV